MVQWLILYASIVGGLGLILGGRTRKPHAAWFVQKTNRKNPKDLAIYDIPGVIFNAQNKESGLSDQ